MSRNVTENRLRLAGAGHLNGRWLMRGVVMALLSLGLALCGCGGNDDERDDGASDYVTQTTGGIPQGKFETPIDPKSLKLETGPDGELSFSGVVDTKMLVPNKPRENWRDIKDSKTDCRILAYEKETFLVEGKVELRAANSLFLVPGSIIENATMSRQAVPIVRPNGGPMFGLRHGERIRITPSGGVRRL